MFNKRLDTFLEANQVGLYYNNIQSVRIFIDLKKAFDTIDNLLLIKKKLWPKGCHQLLDNKLPK